MYIFMIATQPLITVAFVSIFNDWISLMNWGERGKEGGQEEEVDGKNDEKMED